MSQSEAANLLFGSSFVLAYDVTTDLNLLAIPPGEACLKAVNGVIEDIPARLTTLVMAIQAGTDIPNREFPLVPPLDTSHLLPDQATACQAEVQNFVHTMAVNLDASTPMMPLSCVETWTPNSDGPNPDFYVTREQTLLTPDRFPGGWTIAVKRTIHDHLSVPQNPLPLDVQQDPLVMACLAAPDPASLRVVNQVVNGMEMLPGIVDTFVLMKV